ncbi:hypothetical protein M422DRAFT_265830 [Sphaerobolus stellatus SS14]|uniref:Uncharacterized protein n=1 Tax=Sphaerobolus stellatus (strain SS14) TaxID=990650 RepID=A0A0C9V4D8_SPHS4|nr:hypothetical protein M422DRAFT_265830 [Sphaerobolus stellatus SS14]
MFASVNGRRASRCHKNTDSSSIYLCPLIDTRTFRGHRPYSKNDNLEKISTQYIGIRLGPLVARVHHCGFSTDVTVTTLPRACRWLSLLNIAQEGPARLADVILALEADPALKILALTLVRPSKIKFSQITLALNLAGSTRLDAHISYRPYTSDQHMAMVTRILELLISLSVIHHPSPINHHQSLYFSTNPINIALYNKKQKARPQLAAPQHRPPHACLSHSPSDSSEPFRATSLDFEMIKPWIGLELAIVATSDRSATRTCGFIQPSTLWKMAHRRTWKASITNVILTTGCHSSDSSEP